MPKKYLFLNEFIIKIIALLTMTLDHVGIFLILYSSSNSTMYTLGMVFRCIGRLAFPLFIFMLVEGIMHTKNAKLYLLRIGIVTTLIMLTQIIIYYCFSSEIEHTYSPFVDLSLCALTLYLLKRKDKWSFLAILPIGYIFVTTGVQVYEAFNPNQNVLWLPFYLRPGYSLLGLSIALLFYYSHSLSSFLERKYFADIINKQSLTNIIQGLFLLIVNLMIYLLAFNQNLDIYTSSVQTWSMFAALFLLFYNGKRGYNKKWFQYSTYLYFPVHLIIIFLIFFLIYK